MLPRVRHGVGETALVAAVLCFAGLSSPAAAADLVIAASPSLAVPLEALARAFESAHPDTRVRLYYDRALDLRRTVAAIQQDGRHFIGSGEVSLIAPGDDELLDRLAQKYYLLPGARRVYAIERLVMIVPESLAEAPATFEAMAADAGLRVAVADPRESALGAATRELLDDLGLSASSGPRWDVAADARGVLDHVLNGQADVGIVSGADAARERDRVRVAAQASGPRPTPKTHSIAMERFCPDRARCEAFLRFLDSAAARTAIRLTGYDAPTGPHQEPPP
jgi:molybdate transport system substrate-binding protein